MAGKMAISLAELLCAMWDPTNANRSIRPTRFKETIGHYRRRFKGYDQQDAQELLQHLLSCVHEDLNRIVMRPNLELKDSNRRPDSVVASESWQNHLRRDLSIISTLFFGQFKSLLKGKQCGHESATFNPFSILPVPLPERGNRAQVACSVRVENHSNTNIQTPTLEHEQVRLHYADGRMPVDVAVSLSVSEMKQFTVETLLSKISALFPSTSEQELSSTRTREHLLTLFLTIPRCDFEPTIWQDRLMCGVFEGFNEKQDEEEKESSKDQDGSKFQKDEKVQINIQGKRVLYVVVSLNSCQKYIQSLSIMASIPQQCGRD